PHLPPCAVQVPIYSQRLRKANYISSAQRCRSVQVAVPSCYLAGSPKTFFAPDLTSWRVPLHRASPHLLMRASAGCSTNLYRSHAASKARLKIGGYLTRFDHNRSCTPINVITAYMTVEWIR